MEIVENISIENTESHLWEMLRDAILGSYDKTWETDEGKQKLLDAYRQELNRVANEGFILGREYERNRK